MEKLSNLIANQLVPPSTGVYLENIEPAVGHPYSSIPDSGAKDVESAVAAAEQAFPAWASMNVQKRAAIIDRLADLIEEKLEEFAQAESKDNGKPVWLARSVDIPRVISNFRFFASGIQHFASESHATDVTAINYTLRQPIGVVGCISPWNLPLYLFSWKVAPALAAGNTVVAKPSEVTPYTAYLMSHLIEKAGFPPGVFNIVHGTGPGVGAEIVKHPKIKAISFTGGTKTGQHIASVAAPMFKKLSLELGGKNPNIIFADCDFETALKTSVRSSFANQGEICLCGSRMFIEASIYEKFRDAFVERVARIKVGDPSEETSKMGAIVSKGHYEKILSYIDLAKEEGGKISTGGHSIQGEGRCKDGYFIAPTVIEGLDPYCRTNQEEIFGPVVSLTPFESESEVLEYANSTPYGLSCTLWTENLTRAHRMAAEIHSGIVWVNCWLLRDLRTPFGGVKQSGVGREGGWEALRFFTEPKNVCIKL